MPTRNMSDGQMRAWGWILFAYIVFSALVCYGVGTGLIHVESHALVLPRYRPLIHLGGSEWSE